MVVWTSTVYNPALRETDIPVKDITVKSGDKQFSPEWPWLMAYKNKLIDEAAYTCLYEQKMIANLDSAPASWDALIEMDEVILVCYCKKGAFCHRHLLVDMLSSYCLDQEVPFCYAGEYP